MKHYLCLFIMSCFFFCQSSQAEEVHHFNFILFIDKKIIIGPEGLDFILIDSLSNKRDTIECLYNVGDLRIKDTDLEKIKEADSVYIHILTQNVACKFFDYNIRCYAKFYDCNNYIIDIYNRDKNGEKYDYGYYCHLPRKSAYISRFYLANPRRKKNYKYAVEFINW